MNILLVVIICLDSNVSNDSYDLKSIYGHDSHFKLKILSCDRTRNNDSNVSNDSKDSNV